MYLMNRTEKLITFYDLNAYKLPFYEYFYELFVKIS